MSSTDESSAPKQPIHPSFLERLVPEYIEFHNKHVVHLTPPHTLPWSSEIRNAPAVPGGSDPLTVGKIEDFDITYTKVRAFTPIGEPPVGGWPVFIFFHGGGWTLGSIGSENSFCTNMCVGARCVVITVDYRLAPEHPYPGAVDDAVDALSWTVNTGAAALNLNLSKLAVGGSSSGGNLATILAIKAKQMERPIPLIFQLLIVPVTDNTASVENRWNENQLTPWLSPDRMMWFRRKYLPNEDDWSKWDASPIFTPPEYLVGLPPAWIAVAGCDILANEGKAYGDNLRKAGVTVDIEEYIGAPHPIMAMDGALEIGKRLVDDAAKSLARAFNSL
ncbi:hypothetical protein FA15DRAFT_671538 [Coprinopsis marcescibilis]|uniref:Alpha/beta hydrolase fold-3 domain-containing protein n=1 Tax=Coprinopsis marcescibilis TaxID=230819 RepID=A0A5C3KPI7_COPMA|nr:hypothetical protein FA15DRAFT_671538 [Coprinopsis marcescibilis]